MKLERSVRPGRAQGRRRPQQRQHVHPAGPGLGAEHAAARRDGHDLRLDRGAVRRPQGRQARRRGLTGDDRAGRGSPRAASGGPAACAGRSAACRTGCSWPAAGSTSRSCRRSTPSRPVRWWWCRWSPRSATWTAAGWPPAPRVAAQALWGDAFPAGRTPASLVRELYAAENADKAEPSGLAGHVRPDLPGHQPPRLRRDASTAAGSRRTSSPPRDPDVVAWLERVIHLVPVAPRPPGYGPLGHQAPRPGLDRAPRRAAAGPASTRSWRWTSGRSASRSTSARGRGMPSCPRCSSTRRSPIDLRGLLAAYAADYPGAMFSGLRRRLPGRRVRDAAAGLRPGSRCARELRRDGRARPGRGRGEPGQPAVGRRPLPRGGRRRRAAHGPRPVGRARRAAVTGTAPLFPAAERLFLAESLRWFVEHARDRGPAAWPRRSTRSPRPAPSLAVREEDDGPGRPRGRRARPACRTTW